MFRTWSVDGQLGISVPNCWRQVHKADNKAISAATSLENFHEQAGRCVRIRQKKAKINLQNSSFSSCHSWRLTLDPLHMLLKLIPVSDLMGRPAGFFTCIFRDKEIRFKGFPFSEVPCNTQQFLHIGGFNILRCIPSPIKRIFSTRNLKMLRLRSCQSGMQGLPGF